MAMAFDLKLFYLFNDLAGQSRVVDALIIFLAGYMQYVLILAFLLLLYVSGYTKQKKLRILGVTVLSILVARLGVAEMIRFFYHRPRPFAAHYVHQLISENAWSFPSGHSAFFFAMATAVYLYNKKWGVWFFLAAILMNMSRIAAGVHYPSDIAGGMVVGIVVTLVIFSVAERAKPKEIPQLP